MFVPTYIQDLEVTPDYLILSKTQPTHVSLDFKNTFSQQAVFVFYPYFSNRNPVPIEPGESQSVLIEVPPSETYLSPIKIGWITISSKCFPLILPVCYVERLPEFAECPVCCAPYNETTVIPKSIPNCGHTCCESCCDGCKTNENTIICPKCRTISIVRNGIRNLPRNFALLELLRNRELPRPPPVAGPSLTLPRIPCRQNPRHESSLFCLDCESDYCPECFDSIHAAKALEDHKKYDVSFPKCHAHPFIFAEAVCTDSLCPSSGQPVCIPCLERNHKRPELDKPGKLHQHESILKNMEENQKVMIEVRGALCRKEMQMEILRTHLGSKSKAEEIKSDLAHIQYLKVGASTPLKSRCVTDFGSLRDWFEEATEMLLKEYEIETPTPSNTTPGTNITAADNASNAEIEKDVLETINSIINVLENNAVPVDVEHENLADSPTDDEELSQTVGSIVDHLADAVTDSIRLLQESNDTDAAKIDEESKTKDSVSEGQEKIVDETSLICDPSELPSIEAQATSTALMEAEAPEVPKSDVNDGARVNNTKQEEQRKPDETENIVEDAAIDYTAIRARFNLSNERPLIPKLAFKTNMSPKTAGTLENGSMIAPSENQLTSTEASSSTLENFAILNEYLIEELPSFKDRIAKFEEQNRLQMIGKARILAPPGPPTALPVPVDNTNPRLHHVSNLASTEELKLADETEKSSETLVENTVEEPETEEIEKADSENTTETDSLENGPESNSMEETGPMVVE